MKLIFTIKNLDAKTIVVPKIQEIDTLSLLNCYLNFKIKKINYLIVKKNLNQK